jgi:putative tricarboxylic transport membrane protein
MVLGPMMEQALRQGLMMSKGEFGIFLSRPISAAMLAAAFLFLGFHVVATLRKAQARRGAERDRTSVIAVGTRS